MQRTKAPFRADHVGSLLRTAPLKEARARHAKGEIRDAQLKDGRRPRDREDHQEAGGDRAQARDRRRVPALLVALRFLQGPRRRRALLDRPGHQVRGRRDQGRERARRRQGRFLDPPAYRAFPLREGPRQGHAEDDNPGAQHAALPAGPPIDQQGASIPISTPIFHDVGQAYAQGHPRLLRRRLPLSAARRYRLVDDLRSRRSARARASAATIPTACRRATRA